MKLLTNLCWKRCRNIPNCCYSNSPIYRSTKRHYTLISPMTNQILPQILNIQRMYWPSADQRLSAADLRRQWPMQTAADDFRECLILMLRLLPNWLVLGYFGRWFMGISCYDWLARLAISSWQC